MVQIDNEDLKQVRSEFLDTPKYRNTQNAVMKNGIKKSITNQVKLILTHLYSQLMLIQIKF